MFALLGLNQAEQQLSLVVVIEKRAAIHCECLASVLTLHEPRKKKLPMTVSIAQVKWSVLGHEKIYTNYASTAMHVKPQCDTNCS